MRGSAELQQVAAAVSGGAPVPTQTPMEPAAVAAAVDRASGTATASPAIAQVEAASPDFSLGSTPCLVDFLLDDTE